MTEHPDYVTVPKQPADYVPIEVQCAQGRLNRATRALEAAKVVFHIANREYGEASDALIKLKAEAMLGRQIDGTGAPK